MQVIREDPFACALGYDGDDVLDHLGSVVSPAIIMTTDGSKRRRDLSIAVEPVELVDWTWRLHRHVGVLSEVGEAWACYTPHRPTPRSRSANKLILSGSREVSVTYTDGPTLMRLLRRRAERRPDLSLPA